MFRPYGYQSRHYWLAYTLHFCCLIIMSVRKKLRGNSVTRLPWETCHDKAWYYFLFFKKIGWVQSLPHLPSILWGSSSCRRLGGRCPRFGSGRTSCKRSRASQENRARHTWKGEKSGGFYTLSFNCNQNWRRRRNSGKVGHTLYFVLDFFFLLSSTNF